MTDIVERLRTGRSGYTTWMVTPTHREAADEIERLRSALRECAGDLEDELRARYGTPPHPAEARRFARDMEVVEMARRLANGD